MTGHLIMMRMTQHKLATEELKSFIPNNQSRSAEVGKQIKQFKAQHLTIVEQQILELIR